MLAAGCQPGGVGGLVAGHGGVVDGQGHGGHFLAGVMVRLPGRVPVPGCARFPGARRATEVRLAASRGAGRSGSRIREGVVASDRSNRGTGGHRGPAARACPCPRAAGPGPGDPRLDDGFRVRPVSCRGWSLTGLLVGSEPGLTGRVGWLGPAVARGRGGFGALEHVVGQLVVGVGVAEADWQAGQDWSGQSAHISARSRMWSAAISSAISMVFRSLAGMTTAARLSGPGGSGAVCGDGAWLMEGPYGWSWVPS